jgi:hypothetical protein
MKELTDMQKKYIQNLRDEEKREIADNASLINSFKQFCATKGIVMTDSNFKYIQTIGIVACYPNLVGQLCTDFSKDKEGLVDFNFLATRFERRPFATGFLYGDNFILMAHPYFRRGLHPSNNFAPRFTELFWALNQSDIDTFISLDYDRVRINVDNSRYLELDTWYGAQFRNEISAIRDGVSKLRPPVDLDDFTNSFLFADAYSLDIKWETKDGIKSFQAEEFKTDKNKISKNGQDFFPVRYIHAEFDLGKNAFRHFDGAVHFYTAHEYYRRRESDFNYNSKNSFKIKTASEKLFKMNGNISVDTWIEFSSHFFAGNPLVIEYFEGKYPDRITEILDAIQKNKNENGESL